MQVGRYAEEQGYLDFLPAAISGSYVSGLTLERVKVSNVGGGAINLDKGVKDLRIFDCALSNLGGGGILIGDPIMDFGKLPPPSNADLAEGIFIINNSISKVGRSYRSQPGIFVSHARGLNIAQNEISESHHYGLIVGWEWGSDTPTQDVQIYRNNISNTCDEFFDCSPIYLLGGLGGANSSRVRGNFLGSWSGLAALYQDHASAATVDSNYIGLKVNQLNSSGNTVPGGFWIYLQDTFNPVENSIAAANRCKSPFPMYSNPGHNNSVEACSITDDSFSFTKGRLPNAFVYSSSALLAAKHAALYPKPVPTTGSHPP
jgi:hypothetical protein